MLYRRKLALLFVAVALGVSGLATLFVYVVARQHLVEEVESKAMSIAATTAVLIDGDLHRKIADGTAEPGAAAALRRQLDAARDVNRRDDVHASFVYTAVPVPGGGLKAVVEDEVAHGGSSENLAENDTIRQGRVGVEDLKTDEFGRWVTGYAPILDSKGGLAGMLLVDVAATDVLDPVDVLLAGGLAAMVASLLLAGVLALPIARRVTRPLRSLAAAGDRIAAGELDVPAGAESGDEFGRLAAALNRMIPRLRDDARLRDSMHTAQQVQRELLPTHWPSVASFEIAATSIYCDEIGGDYYDVVDLSANEQPKLGIVVGDVAGHGIAAALLMATTRAILRSRLAPERQLANVVTEANRSIVQDRFSGRFVTLFAAVVDTHDLRLHWVCAGHEPAILYDPPTDTFEELGGEDIPLGVRQDWSYREYTRDGWRHGQVILIGTDGIWETRDLQGRRFGKDALRDLVRANAHRSPREIQDAVLRALADFRGSRTQEDDVTLVVLKA